MKGGWFHFITNINKNPSPPMDYLCSKNLFGLHACSNWIWLFGNTRKYHKQLKEIGFFYAPKKKMWYWKPNDYKSANRKPRSMEYIRFKYGSDVVDRQENYKIESSNI